MTKVATPSAKAHERVTGRWTRDIKVENTQDWIVYYIKQITGTPIPWLFLLFGVGLFTSRAVVEVSAWAVALLTWTYLLADRLSRPREFRFFTVGTDLPLLLFVFVGIVSVLVSLPSHEYLNGIGVLRWVLLMYGMTYCWDLFPGLVRMYSVLLGSALVASLYGIVQHFFGIDPFRTTPLEFGPFQEHAYFAVRGFLSTPEIFGTMIACILPFPAAAYMLHDDEDRRWQRWASLAFALILVVALFFTYRPGLWMSGAVGLAFTLLFFGKRFFKLLISVATVLMVLSLVLFGSENVLTRTLDAEALRGNLRRDQINQHLKIFDENPWIGNGMQNLESKTDHINGNIYFQLLAETGGFGLFFYGLFILGSLLGGYQIWQEIPESHYWHRVLALSSLGSQMAFHVAGLCWSTLNETHAISLFVFVTATLAYLRQRYDHSLVPDDFSL